MPLPAKGRRKRKKRQVTETSEGGCMVEQIKGRAPDQPAYLLTVFVFDSESTPFTEWCGK